MKNGNNRREIAIGQLGEVVTGGTPSTKNPEFFGDQYPFITPSDLDFDSRTVKTERYLSEEGRGQLKNRLLPPNAICFTSIGATIGKMCMTTYPSFTNQQINSIVVDQTRHDPWFVYYLLKTQIEQIKALAGGSATPIVSKSKFAEAKVFVPPLPTQRKIAAILSAYDDLIENNTRRIAILEQMAQLLYREWFVRFRFPGHGSALRVESALGEIPEGWEVKRLGEVCDLTMGQSPSSEFYNEVGEGLPFHQGVTDFGNWFPNTRVYCTQLNRIAEDGDILFSVRAPVGRINLADRRIVIGRGVSAIRSKTGNQAFLLQQLKEKFQEEDSIGGGTIFKAVTKSDMQDILLMIPPVKLVTEFEQIAKPILQQIRNLTYRNVTLRATRDLLLPRLISGEVDVAL
jgi:type I restriction enzyme S subunit